MSNEQALRIARRMEELLLGRSQPGRQQQLKRMVRELVETLDGKHAIPTVRARRSASGNRYIVDYCPYCAGAHYHQTGGDTMQRMADCLNGEYILEVSGEDS